MVQKHTVIPLIAPVTLAGILIMTILAVTANAQESNNAGNGQESNNAGNGQESNSTGNAEQSSNAGNARQESNSTGNGQENSNAGNAEQSSNAGNARSTGVPENVTSPSGSTASNNTGNASADFANSILVVHNSERSDVKVPPLVWSDELAAEAKTWAEHLAATGELVHSSYEERHGEGENFAWMSPPAYTGWASLVQMSWVAEKDYYQGKSATPPATGTTTHYTQMVWNTTKAVGCGTASGGGKGILVCRYSPAGNIDGQRPY
jgi:uncharacterized protein YkwD